MVTQGIVLSHIVSKNVIEVDKDKVELIPNLPTPKCVRDIRSFVGHAGFYRRFIKYFSAIARPLCNLLAKDVPFAWSQACEVALDKLKTMLVSPPIMRSPDWNLPFEIMCDASDYAIGAVLGQREEKMAFVIYYASKTLDSAQANYTTIEKEFLAVVFALEKFRSYIVGSPVTIFTDHAALKYLLSKQDTKPWLARWILLCQEFNLTIKDKKGVENVVADHLSRLVPESSSLGVPIGDSFPDEQLFALVHRPWYANIVNYLVIGQIPPQWTSQQKGKFMADIKKYYFDDPYLFKYYPDQLMRRCVPSDDQIGILTFCHSQACEGHFSAWKTTDKILQACFYWPTLFKDCFEFYKTCARCQQFGGVTKRNMMPLTPILILEIFDCWGIDFMGPFLPSCVYLYIFLSVDYVSKWVEAIPTRTNDHKVVLKFIKEHIFSRFGVPHAIISDSGLHFCNRSFENFLKKHGVTHKVSRHITHKTMVKPNKLIGRSNTFWKKRVPQIAKIGRFDFSMLFGLTILLLKLFLVCLPIGSFMERLVI